MTVGRSCSLSLAVVDCGLRESATRLAEDGQPWPDLPYFIRTAKICDGQTDDEKPNEPMRSRDSQYGLWRYATSCNPALDGERSVVP